MKNLTSRFYHLISLMFLGMMVGYVTYACTGVTKQKPMLPAEPMGMGQIIIDRVTNDPEEESWLRVSPDGRYLLFNFGTRTYKLKATSLGQLLVAKILGPSPEEIEEIYKGHGIAMIEVGKPGRSIVSPEGAIHPAWLPDSRGFVFSMLQGDRTLMARAELGQAAAAVRFVSPVPCDQYDRSPSVSPDRKKILFTTRGEQRQDTIAVLGLTPEGLADPSAKCTLLFEGAYPQWHPKFNKFVFQRVVMKNWHIFTFDMQRNLLTQITFGNFDNIEPSWSLDGKHIVFVSDRNGTADIFVMQEDGTGLEQITQGPTQDRFPAWSVDGNIYFISNAGNQIDIWRARFQR